MKLLFLFFLMITMTLAIVSRSFDYLKNGMIKGSKYYLRSQLSALIPRDFKLKYQLVKKDIGSIKKIRYHLNAGLNEVKKIVSFKEGPKKKQITPTVIHDLD
ncbi:hypothetical protein K502DRAFT_20697 [Neoconidiobolus thromboides FSU 785]|nr:hypothetical protein K502DRAFT_20697 [Neoconidiobolus thromboides FSU 785]